MGANLLGKKSTTITHTPFGTNMKNTTHGTSDINMDEFVETTVETLFKRLSDNGCVASFKGEVTEDMIMIHDHNELVSIIESQMREEISTYLLDNMNISWSKGSKGYDRFGIAFACAETEIIFLRKEYLSKIVVDIIRIYEGLGSFDKDHKLVYNSTNGTKAQK